MIFNIGKCFGCGLLSVVRKIGVLVSFRCIYKLIVIKIREDKNGICYVYFVIVFCLKIVVMFKNMLFVNNKLSGVFSCGKVLY